MGLLGAREGGHHLGHSDVGLHLGVGDVGMLMWLDMVRHLLVVNLHSWIEVTISVDLILHVMKLMRHHAVIRHLPIIMRLLVMEMMRPSMQMLLTLWKPAKALHRTSGDLVMRRILPLVMAHIL